MEQPQLSPLGPAGHGPLCKVLRDLCAVWLAVFIFLGDLPIAQAQSPAVGLPDFQPIVSTGRVERSLRQFEALVADQAWDEAIDLVETIQAEHAEALIPIGSSEDSWKRYETVAKRCQKLMVQLPEEGLTHYRRRIDDSAERLYKEGVEAFDPQKLLRVVREFYASSWSDDALYALSELALQRGDTTAARRWLSNIHPELLGPEGEPAAVALATVSESVEPKTLQDVWLSFQRPDDLITTPESDYSVAMALTRLAYASILDGNLKRAQIEIRLLEAIAPSIEGRFGGKIQPIASALREQLIPVQESKSTEPLPVHQWVWEESIQLPSLSPQDKQMQNRMRQIWFAQNQARMQQAGNMLQMLNRAAVEESFPSIAIADGSDIFITNGAQFYQLDQRGKAEPFDIGSAIGLKTKDQTKQQTNQEIHLGLAQIRIVNGRRNGQPTVSTPVIGSHKIHDHVLYGIQVETLIAGRNQKSTHSVLYGLDLKRDKKLVLQLDSKKITDSADYHFASAPVLREDRVYVALKGGTVGAQLAVACFNREGDPLWIRPIGRGQLSTRSTTLLLGTDTLYFSSNQGAVAALDLADGRMRWVTCYPRAPLAPANVSQLAPSAPEQPILVGDLLFLSPADLSGVIALDATSGRLVWWNDSDDSSARLLGARGDSLVVAGKRFELLDPMTGHLKFAWPESPHAGIRGMGTGLLVGDEVFWPTRDTLYSFDARSGQMSRAPVDTSELGLHGVNLTQADQQLVVLGSKRINLLGNYRIENQELKPRFSRLKHSRMPWTLGYLQDSPTLHP